MRIRMNNSYQRQKYLLLTYISLITGIYCTVIFILAQRLGSGIEQVLLLGQSCVIADLTPAKLILESNLPLLIAVLVLAIKIPIAAVSSALKIWRTRQAVKLLPVIANAGELKVIESTNQHLFTSGILHPQTIMSVQVAEELSAQELSAALAHETYHRQQYDPLLGALVNLFSKILPPFPAKQELLQSYATLTELAADDYAIQESGSRTAIISALSKLLQTGTANLSVGLTSMANRIEVLTESRQFNWNRLILLSLVSILMLNVPLMVAVSAHSPANNVFGAACHKPSLPLQSPTTIKEASESVPLSSTP
jgi:hypothetical protein